MRYLRYGIGRRAGSRNGRRGEAKQTIAVVAKGETHAFWQSVKNGAQAAGEKYGYAITFRGPTAESEEHVNTQREMVTQALNNKNTKALDIGDDRAGIQRRIGIGLSIKGSPLLNSTAVCTATEQILQRIKIPQFRRLPPITMLRLA